MYTTTVCGLKCAKKYVQYEHAVFYSDYKNRGNKSKNKN